MALSYMTESEAPRDFRISTTESENHYTKCLLCYTIKKNFYCVECIKAGNFLHSSMPYSDRFSDKQAKLIRLKANRKHVQDRCETLLLKKSKHDSLQTEVKQCRNKIDLIKLAIEQRRHNIEEKKKEIASLKNCNTEFSLRIPRYQKRVSIIRKHMHDQKVELENRARVYEKSVESLGALRRARIRQLTKYIFPVYITYDSSESMEDMEFLHVEAEEGPCRERLHVVAAWLPATHDYRQIHTWVSQNQEGSSAAGSTYSTSPALSPGHRSSAALSLAAQLTSLLAWLCDVRLPYPLSLTEFSWCRGAGHAHSAEWLSRRVAADAVWLALVSGQAGATPRRALSCLHALSVAASTDDPALGSVSSWPSLSVSAVEEAWRSECALPQDDSDPLEHITWSETLEMEELSSTPPASQLTPSLVTSAAASLASLWRGWTK